MIRRFIAAREGTTAIEYAVIASLLAVTVLAAMPVGDMLTGMFENVAAGFQKEE